MKVCIGCKKCASTNRCIHNDDINPILEKIIKAEAIIMSGYPSFGSVNALTKIFIERLWPLRHNYFLAKGKASAAVVCGNVAPKDLENYFSRYFTDYMRTRHQGALTLDGNAPCMSCGFGEDCEGSGFLRIHGPGAKITQDKFRDFSRDEEAGIKARRLGEAVGEAIRNPAGVI
jgi:multimeric flavodoxin WrbA